MISGHTWSKWKEGFDQGEVVLVYKGQADDPGGVVGKGQTNQEKVQLANRPIFHFHHTPIHISIDFL